MKRYDQVFALTSAGKVVSAWTPGFGGIAEGVLKMAIGNELGFRYEESISDEEIFGYNYGAFLLEAAEDAEMPAGAILLGSVTADYAITRGEESLCLNALEKAYEEAKAEARACFGNDEMYIEKLILNPRHIEFQILADEFGNVVHLGERDCSIQRKNQKLIEESPCMLLSQELREQMGTAAVNAAKAAGYTNAGTVEFVLDEQEHFYFIEMNTRIQVEHPVTEMVTGLDLVKEQLRIASHRPLSYKQEDILCQGHAMECRINAEDPAKGFMPNSGKIRFLNFPGGLGVRVDTALYNGYETSPFYDSMMAKIIVHGKTRLDTIRKMRRALEELVIEGITTNGDFDYLVLHHPDFIKGKYNVGFIEEHLDELLAWDALAESDEPLKGMDEPM